MSYILDALKKSEEERHQGQVPSLGGSSTLIHSSANKSAVWPWVIAVLLLLNMMFISYWLMSTDKSDNQNIEVTDIAPEKIVKEIPTSASVALERYEEPAAVSRPNNLRVDPIVHVEVTKKRPEYTLPEPELITPSMATIEPRVQQQEQSILEEPMLITPKSGARSYKGPSYSETNEEVTIDEPDYSSVKHVSDFPSSFQRRIPDLSFNSHIYTNTPDSRRVMINNIYLREGQVFSGLTVVQITEEGVVLSLGGEAFKVGVLRDWRSPR